jgi:putative addiction module component (TIGR02574 family)
MISSTQEILEAIRALPAEQRNELLEILLSEDAPPEVFVSDEEFARELDRRQQEMEDGTDPGMSLDEFVRRSRQILES